MVTTNRSIMGYTKYMYILKFIFCFLFSVLNLFPVYASSELRNIKILNTNAKIINNRYLPLVDFIFIFKNPSIVYSNPKYTSISNVVCELINRIAFVKDKEEFYSSMINNHTLINCSIHSSIDEYIILELNTFEHNIKKAIELLADLLNYTNSKSFVINEKTFELTKQAVKYNILNKINIKSPSILGREKLLNSIFKNEIYIKDNDAALNSLDYIKISDLKKTMSQIFTIDNMEIIIIGMTEQQNIEKYFKVLYNTLKTNTEIDNKQSYFTDYSNKHKGKTEYFSLNSKQSSIALGRISPSNNDFNYYNSLVASEIFSGPWLGALLYKKLREESGLTYHFTGSVIESYYANFYMALGAVSDLTKSTDIIKNIFDDVKNNGLNINQNDFELIKKRMCNRRSINIDRKPELMIIRSIISGESLDQFNNYCKYVDSVKFNDMNKFAKQFFDIKYMNIININSTQSTD
jgi:predicted Zn-dependent peptidase